jgi:hypothetical protein
MVDQFEEHEATALSVGRFGDVGHESAVEEDNRMAEFMERHPGAASVGVSRAEDTA